ncbi:MAG: signal recognition particle-docking protein FtsY [Candidatus Sumerlaeota bacterium]|nr:signal recognition particle-docking protein FtsY [Candidatus Sumerlaeota bacterium]
MALFRKQKNTVGKFETPEQGVTFNEPQPETAAAATAPPHNNNEAQGTGESAATGGGSGFFGRARVALTDRLKRTKESFIGQIRAVIKAAGKVDEDLIEKIGEILIKADAGAQTTNRIVEKMRDYEARGSSPAELLDSFKKEIAAIIGQGEQRLALGQARPFVILVVGVNGTGKTTTIGKLAGQYRQQGHKVMMVAADTFRAAAIEQLEIWAKRTGSMFVSKSMGADPAGVVYDALEKSAAAGADIILVDTAGRLHTKTNLMEELKKIVRVAGKLLPGSPHEILLVLDATTGQNAISQARVFTKAIPITGLVMTKLDGTAKGGVLVGIRDIFATPVVKIGVGEGMDDLRDFDPNEFVEALFSE